MDTRLIIEKAELQAIAKMASTDPTRGSLIFIDLCMLAKPGDGPHPHLVATDGHALGALTLSVDREQEAAVRAAVDARPHRYLASDVLTLCKATKASGSIWLDVESLSFGSTSVGFEVAPASTATDALDYGMVVPRTLDGINRATGAIVNPSLLARFAIGKMTPLVVLPMRHLEALVVEAQGTAVWGVVMPMRGDESTPIATVANVIIPHNHAPVKETSSSVADAIAKADAEWQARYDKMMHKLTDEVNVSKADLAETNDRAERYAKAADRLAAQAGETAPTQAPDRTLALQAECDALRVELVGLYREVLSVRRRKGEAKR